MTKLLKAIKRETNGFTQFGRVIPGKALVICLEPPNIVRIKEKGKHLWYETTMESVFSMAAKQTAAARLAERKREKQLRKIVKM